MGPSKFDPIINVMEFVSHKCAGEQAPERKFQGEALRRAEGSPVPKDGSMTEVS